MAEPFEINEVEAFKPLNKTRQIHYPMMVRKYGLDRIDDSSLDFFRDAMSVIVRQDNDELFNRFLSQKSGRASNV